MMSRYLNINATLIIDNAVAKEKDIFIFKKFIGLISLASYTVKIFPHSCREFFFPNEKLNYIRLSFKR